LDAELSLLQLAWALWYLQSVNAHNVCAYGVWVKLSLDQMFPHRNPASPERGGMSWTSKIVDLDLAVIEEWLTVRVANNWVLRPLFARCRPSS
jgi:hypothetical protein